MKIQALLASALVVSTQAFVPTATNNGVSTTQLHAEIGETGISFEHVAREWRCKVR